MMNDSPARRYTRIIAAVDPDPEDPVRDALNNLVMTLATSISAADNGELHVVNAWYCDTAETLRHSAFARSSSEDINKLIYAERKIRKAYLDQLLAPYTNILQAHRIHLLNGIARQIIPSFARDRRADLIVMGTVGRTGVRGFFIGNTAEAILNQVACSVLAVKPPGFETPVMLDGPAADMASISSSA
jgi:nucleotide-binding universal stress UspA family protein